MMKKIFLCVLIVFPVLSNAQKAKIKIDTDRATGEIDSKIYGVFMEPIRFGGKGFGLPDSVYFNTLYGTLYDPGSSLANENGFRKDYIEAMRELKVTNIRWPGGNYVMGYNWQDGIGPKDRRPSRINLAWGGTDNNHVGTDEWIALNKDIGSENVICVNLGLGNIQDACGWLEYCNYEKGTYYSDIRIKNGHAEPYNLKIWGLGNEVDGAKWELGYKNADDYVKIARETIKAMRAVDNTIRFVASGSSYYDDGQWVEWNRKILSGLGDMTDYISIHSYWGSSPEYYSFMGELSMEFEKKITVTTAEIEAVSAMNNYKKPIYISVDEWGAFGRDFRSVLPIALCFNSFIRHADMVKMANFTLLTSLLGNDREKGTFKTPLFYTFKTFSNNCRGTSVDTYVVCDTFNTENYKGIPFLDVTTVYSKEIGMVYINVVNRNKEKAISTDIFNTACEFNGKAEASIINCTSLNEPFTYDKKEQYIPQIKEIKTEKNEITFSFPAHSFTQIKAELKRH